jgi:hypothetical protein
MPRRFRGTYSTIEDPIHNICSLRTWMRDLEEDEGLRIVGRARPFAGGGFLFVSIHQGKYRVNICDRIRHQKKANFIAGEGGEWHEFETFEEAWKFVSQKIRRPVQAWVY